MCVPQVSRLTMPDLTSWSSVPDKESANCRLEANYAHQQEKEMIPLMMQKDYQPKGWRKCQCRVLIVLNCRRYAVHVRELRLQSDIGRCRVRVVQPVPFDCAQWV